jgi:hypothetical protein
MAANLYAAGAGEAGQQTRGVSAQYQLDGKNGNAELSSTSINPGGGPSGVTPYDSGTILGHVQPGGSGKKLVDGTVQRSSQLICDATAGVTGNSLQPTSGVGVTPTPPATQGQAKGLSSGPEFE